uniref:Uncharacterized protein n=1 Tax=Opuntia streptacantha TaxID=393608 RepID=A0A7C9EJQ4_OPUST
MPPYPQGTHSNPRRGSIREILLVVTAQLRILFITQNRCIDIPRTTVPAPPTLQNGAPSFNHPTSNCISITQITTHFGLESNRRRPLLRGCLKLAINQELL